MFNIWFDKYSNNYFLDSDAALEKYCQQNLKGQNAASLKNSIVRYQQSIFMAEQRAKGILTSQPKAKAVEEHTVTKIDLSDKQKVSEENIDLYFRTAAPGRETTLTISTIDA